MPRYFLVSVLLLALLVTAPAIGAATGARGLESGTPDYHALIRPARGELPRPLALEQGTNNPTYLGSIRHPHPGDFRACTQQ